MDTLSGLIQFCPLCCGEVLIRHMPDTSIGEKHWYCKNCGSEWDAPELLEAINYEEAE